MRHISRDAKSSLVATVPLEIPLYKSDLDNHQRRFVAYYEQLKFWSENYDHLLTDIDYSLDRPVFRQADKEAYRTSSQTLNQINCSKPLTGELQRLQLDSNSLKLRFAVINKCFMDTNEALGQLLNQAISPVAPVYNESVALAVNRNLDSIHMKANKFRCYALGRIDYYKAQKELSILSISYAWRWLEDVEKQGAQKHFEDTAKYCG